MEDVGRARARERGDRIERRLRRRPRRSRRSARAGPRPASRSSSVDGRRARTRRRCPGRSAPACSAWRGRPARCRSRRRWRRCGSPAITLSCSAASTCGAAGRGGRREDLRLDRPDDDARRRRAMRRPRRLRRDAEALDQRVGAAPRPARRRGSRRAGRPASTRPPMSALAMLPPPMNAIVCIGPVYASAARARRREALAAASACPMMSASPSGDSPCSSKGSCHCGAVSLQRRGAKPGAVHALPLLDLPQDGRQRRLRASTSAPGRRR